MSKNYEVFNLWMIWSNSEVGFRTYGLFSFILPSMTTLYLIESENLTIKLQKKKKFFCFKLLKILKKCQKLGITNNLQILKRIKTFIVQKELQWSKNKRKGMSNQIYYRIRLIEKIRKIKKPLKIFDITSNFK